MKNKDKGKLCLLMTATILINASFNIPREATHHTVTKIDKNIEENLDENISKLPGNVVELPDVAVLPESTSNVFLENMAISDLYNLDDATINYYYETYGYEKAINYICEHYNITFEQFKVVCAIIMAEGNPDVTYQYKESYAITSILYNRIHSISAINFVNAYDYYDGHNIFYQAICPYQFEVYQNGNYLKFFGVLSGDAFRGIIDMLISERPMHNYLSYRFADSNVLGESFTPGGNIYFQVLSEADRYEKKSLQTR